MKLPGRAGAYDKLGRQRRFIPKPLPPSPPLEMNQELTWALSAADRALARLDGATLYLLNPDLFVYAFMRQEAVLSSQIEGTQASIEDVLEFESGTELEKTLDITEVINYLSAMDYGLDELNRLPVCARLMRGLHARLLSEGRGSEKNPGEFRENQNWIGPPGCSIEEATFVPPPVDVMLTAISDWETFVNEEIQIPPLIKCALAHAQFETIHPFWDGNGRLGRMAITLILCSEKVLSRPILYLSLFFKQHRDEYYRLLQAVRDDGDWESWVIFFLRGVTTTSRAALKTSYDITTLRESMLEKARTDMRSGKASTFAETLFSRPYLKIPQVKDALGITYPTANSLVREFEDFGFVKKVRGGSRDRVYAFTPYLDILHEAAGDLTGIIGSEDYLITNSQHDEG
ncbi:hypothetical protein CKO28_07475 [Rhodovibrio sodomensis]|uniref:Fido domain-containing protein n=1 Tax=Rhodovibrio sodomensis TaxID=1088 RepID=A0ABS1DBN8_9PROT|nr:Fic family protein [Rhodovibrio sodomensis]MBK1667873.1 hypothetical protein [Rhodovibrio sodomensis]